LLPEAEAAANVRTIDAEAAAAAHAIPG